MNFTDCMFKLGNKKKSVMAKWLEQVSQRHNVYCYDLEVLSSNPS